MWQKSMKNFSSSCFPLENSSTQSVIQKCSYLVYKQQTNSFKFQSSKSPSSSHLKTSIKQSVKDNAMIYLFYRVSPKEKQQKPWSMRRNRSGKKKRNLQGKFIISHNIICFKKWFLLLTYLLLGIIGIERNWKVFFCWQKDCCLN
jgi:hypothetical protein